MFYSPPTVRKSITYPQSSLYLKKEGRREVITEFIDRGSSGGTRRDFQCKDLIEIREMHHIWFRIGGYNELRVPKYVDE